MKAKLIGNYLFIAVLFGTGSWLFGENSYRGYAYNLGVGIVWPVSLFKSYPEFDGSTPVQYAKSYLEVVRSHPNDVKGHVEFNEALGLLSYYYYAKENENINIQNYQTMFEQGRIDSGFFKQMLENPKLSEQIRDYTDGMTFGDLVSDRDDIEDDLIDLLEDRT